MITPPEHPIDQGKPNAARIYDYLLGGPNNYEADQQAAKRLLVAVPYARVAARDNRAFLRRAVRTLAAEGIEQFIDIGAGLPAGRALHEEAREVCPAARVAYVDIDPVVTAHYKRALAGVEGVSVSESDLSYPRLVMLEPGVREVIDFGQPVAVLMVAVLHFIPKDARKVIQTITERVAAGSYVVLTHVTSDQMSTEDVRIARAAYADVSVPSIARTLREVEGLMAGLELVTPGVTDVRCLLNSGTRASHPVLLWAGIGKVVPPLTA